MTADFSLFALGVIYDYELISGVPNTRRQAIHACVLGTLGKGWIILLNATAGASISTCYGVF